MAHLLLLLITSLYTVSLYSMKDIEYYKKKEEKEILEYKEFSRYRATTLKDYSDSIIDACFDCNNNVIIATKNKIRFFNKNKGSHPLNSFCYALNAKELLNGLDRKWQYIWSNAKEKQLYASTDLFFYKNSKKFTQCLVLLQYDEKLEKFVPQQKGYFKNKYSATTKLRTASPRNSNCS